MTSAWLLPEHIADVLPSEARRIEEMRRKLLDLARILMAAPRLILLDEPVAGVAPALREELLAHVLGLRADRGLSFLIVEHDLGFVMQASDRVVVMNEGRVLVEGTPDEVRNDERVIDAYLGTAA